MSFVDNEFEILEKTVPDAVILPFRQEITALVAAFINSGQSGGSAPFVSGAISAAVKTLMRQLPIAPLTGEDDEWFDHGDNLWQNTRCSAVFKDKDGPYYLDAIIWQGPEDSDTFTGRVYAHDVLESSRQRIAFPFKPKSFYVPVEYLEITEAEGEGELHYIEDQTGQRRKTVVKDYDALREAKTYFTDTDKGEEQ